MSVKCFGWISLDKDTTFDTCPLKRCTSLKLKKFLIFVRLEPTPPECLQKPLSTDLPSLEKHMTYGWNSFFLLLFDYLSITGSIQLLKMRNWTPSSAIDALKCLWHFEHLIFAKDIFLMIIKSLILSKKGVS